jgi:hypothetical protein
MLAWECGGRGGERCKTRCGIVVRYRLQQHLVHEWMSLVVIYEVGLLPMYRHVRDEECDRAGGFVEFRLRSVMENTHWKPAHDSKLLKPSLLECVSSTIDRRVWG